MPLLDDMSTTVRPTPGFLLTTTTMAPVTQMTQDCVHNDQVIADGASITTEKACEHCYCMKGDIVCVVQECGAPMENEGKNCTSLPPREGQCCPDTYICEGDELSTEIATESSTDSLLEKLTTLAPPRRGGVEGSGYRNEPSEAVYTEMPTAGTELEGSGEEEEPTKATDIDESLLTGKPIEPERMTPSVEDGDQYIPVTTKTPTVEEPETATKEIDAGSILDGNIEQETTEPQSYVPTTLAPTEEQEDKIVGGVTEDESLKPHDHVTIPATSAPESYEGITTESVDSLTSAPVQEPEKPDEYTPITSVPVLEETGTTISDGGEGIKDISSVSEPEPTKSSIAEEIPVSEYVTPSHVPEDIEKETTVKSDVDVEHITEKESSATVNYIETTTSAAAVEEGGPVTPKESEEVTFAEILKDKESTKPAEYVPITTGSPDKEIVELTTEPDHAQNTVAVAEEGYTYPHVSGSEELEKTPIGMEDTVTEKVTKDESLEHHEQTAPPATVSVESEMSTAEPDKGLNTIPSEIDEETSSQSSLVDRTTVSVEEKSTEPSISMHATESQDIDTKLSTQASAESPMPSEPHVTKVDQYTITTEPSFRREDEVRITTEKSKEESAATTIKAEFVDEGLIPTSTHEEKPSTGSDTSTTDEEITTTMPEYSQGLEETIDSKHPSTDTIEGTTIVSEVTPEKTADNVSELEGELPSSTEKAVDVTALSPDVDTPEEPSRIPGEGDCLLNGITYRNNTVVPSTNNCHTGCKCVSSIIKCDPIICSPPPDYMDNCQSIYDTPDSCCPTYVCDHPKETIPPQSDNQMSGTEPPMPPPVIECRGDQCELSEPTKEPMEPPEPCASGACVPTDHKPTTSECGPEGCVGTVEEPQPPVKEPECIDGKCAPPLESCAHGECKLPPTEGQIYPTKPCEGDDCKETGAEIPSPPCENEEDCKKQQIPVIQTIPCEGEACTSAECGSAGCSPDVVVPSQDSQQVPCKEEDGCKSQEIIPSDCTGDLPCRRKETPADNLPPKCVDGDCIQKTDTTESQQIPLEEVTEKIAPAEELPGPTESQIPQHDTTPIAQFTTEKEDEATEHPTYETTETETKSDDTTRKSSEEQDRTTDQPTLIEEEGTKKPTLAEVEEPEKTIEDQATDKPVTIDEDAEKPSVIQEEDITKKPEAIDKEQTGEEKGTETPVATIEEHTDKPDLIEEESTKVPDVQIEEHTAKSTLTEEEGTKIPDIHVEEYTGKPSLPEEEATKIPEVVVEEQTGKPALTEEEGTMKPEVTGKPSLAAEEGASITDATDKSVTAEEEGTKATDLAEGYTDKPTLAEETGLKEPEVVEEQTEKPGLLEETGTKGSDVKLGEQTDKPALDEETGTKVPDVRLEEQTKEPGLEEEDKKITDTIEKEHTDTVVTTESIKTSDIEEGYTDEPVVIEETGTKVPAVVVEEQTDKPAIIEEQGTNIPDIIMEEHTEKSQEEGIKVADISEGYTDEPAIMEETGTKIPSTEKEEKPMKPDGTAVQAGGTEIPDVAVVQPSDKPPVIEDYSTKLPDVITEDHTTEPALGEHDGEKLPGITGEGQTDKPTLIDEEGTKMPDDVTEQQTDKSVPSEEEGTKVTDITLGYTDKPVLIEEMSTILPDVIVEEQTNEPAKVEDSDVKVEEQTGKPVTTGEEELKIPEEEQGTKEPDTIVEELTGKPGSEAETGTKIPDVGLEDYTKTPIVIDKDDTKIADVDTDKHKPAVEEEQTSIKHDIDVEVPTDKTELTEDTTTQRIDSVEEHVEKKPPSVEDEITKTPDIDTGVPGEDTTKTPVSVEQEPERKPGLLEEEGITDHPVSDVEGTEMPEITEVSDTKKPILIDESTLAPAEIEYGTETKSPIDEASTEKPVFIDDKTKATPTLIEEATKEPGLETTSHTIEKEYTNEPHISEVYTETPKPSEEQEDVSHSPKDEGTRRTETDKLPESPVDEQTEMAATATKSPIDELQSQSVATEEDSKLKPIDLEKPVETIPSEAQDSGTSVPEIQTHEIVTPSLTELEKTTMLPPSEPISEDKLSHIPHKEHVTSPQESSTFVPEGTKTPDYIVTTESVDKITKSTEQEAISEQGEIYTDMPEQESSVTKSPVDIIIEPQDGEQPASPDVPEKAPEDVQSATTVYEKDVMTPVAPESHVTSGITEYGSTSAVPETEIAKVTEVPELVEGDIQKTELPIPEETESEKTPTEISVDVGDQDIKMGQPEIFTPEKEEMITSTLASVVTEPVKGSTEIEDTYVTGQGEATTESFQEPIDHVASTSEKPDESSESLSSEKPSTGSKITDAPEESYTEKHEIDTEEPILRETQPADILAPHQPEMSTVSSVEVPIATESSEKPELSLHGDQDVGTEPAESDTKRPDSIEQVTTGLPIPVETEPQAKPVVPADDGATQEEKTTKLPDSEISTSIDLRIPEVPAATDLPESHISATVETESKPTEPPTVQEHVTEDQATDVKSEEPGMGDTRRTTTTPEVTSQSGDMQAPDLTHTESEDLGMKEHPADVQKSSTEHPVTVEVSPTELPYSQATTEASLSLVTEPHSGTTVFVDTETEKHDTEPETHTESQERITEKPDIVTVLPEVTTPKQVEEVTSAHADFSETTSYLIELEEHTHKTVDEISTTSRTVEEYTHKIVEDMATTLPGEEELTHKAEQDVTTPSLSDEHTVKVQEHVTTTLPSVDFTHKTAEYTSTTETRRYSPDEVTERITEEEMATKEVSGPSEEASTIASPVSQQTTLSSALPDETSEKLSESSGPTESTVNEEITTGHEKYDTSHKEETTAKTTQSYEGSSETPFVITDTEKTYIAESDIIVPTEKESSTLHPDIHVASQAPTVPEDELILSTTKATTIKQEEILTPVHEDKYDKPEEKPTSEIMPPSTTAEIPKPPVEMQPTDEISPPDDDGHFPPSGTGYGEPDYVEEDQAFGPGTCRYGGKVYVSAQQIPRDDPCDFCFCFRSDIICLQQSCPPPIHGCHEEPIQGFCCPRYECPVSMATTVNVTTTTTTTTTTLPPHFPTHSYKGAAQRRGCQIKGHTYKVGEVVRSSSGPCLHCT